MRAYTKKMSDGETIVKVQLNKKQVEKLCWYFGMTQLLFSACEFLSQGHGWYMIIGRLGKDSASVGLRHIATALQATQTKAQLAENAKVETCVHVGRAVVKVETKRGHRVSTLVTRTITEADKQAALDEEIARLLKKAVGPTGLAEKVAQLNARFH